MKKNATLLIQQIETIYAMYPKLETVYHNAYIAVYHDRILNIGSGYGSEYIDKDTKIINGRNHIALPGFLDISLQCDLFQHRTNDSAHQLITLSNQLLKHGTMLVHSDDILPEIKTMMTHPSLIDLHDETYIKNYSIVYPLHKQTKGYKRCCISCGYDSAACLDQWLCAKLYQKRYPNIDPLKILAACTRYPAYQLKLYDYGILKKGAKADILLFYGNELSAVLHRFYGDEVIHVIKDGIRFYPSPIIY